MPAQPIALFEPSTQRVNLHALLLRGKLDLTQVNRKQLLSQTPITATTSSGLAVLFRSGVAVLFYRDESIEPMATLAALGLNLPLDAGEIQFQEQWHIRTDPDLYEGIQDDEVIVHDWSLERLQLVAWAVSKSLVLEEFEKLIELAISEVEPLTISLQEKGQVKNSPRALLKHIGKVLRTKQQMSLRANLIDKPDLLWEHPELESFYHKLEDYLDIRERHGILVRKLDLISTTASTSLELLNTRYSHRLEWYIVILIVLEIVLTVYELFFHG